MDLTLSPQEQEFRDDKSGGFQLEDSQLTDPTSVSRLLLVMSVACLHLVSLGTFVVEREQRPSVDPHWLRGLSYFQIGWRWLRRALVCRACLCSVLVCHTQVYGLTPTDFL